MQETTHRVASFGFDGELAEFAEIADPALARRFARKSSRRRDVAYATVTDGMSVLVYARGKNRLRLVSPDAQRRIAGVDLLHLPSVGGEGEGPLELPLADALQSRQQLLLERRTAGALPERDARLLERIEAALRSEGLNQQAP